MRSAEAVATMACPVCKTGLTLSDRSGVEIDYCQMCRGVWLDRGELDKIIERSAEYATSRRDADPPSANERRSDYRDDDRDDRYRHGKRKKSVLSELVD